MSPKASLGYASRTAAVIALRAQGHSTAQIATALGIETKTVVALEISATRKKSVMATAPTQLGRAVLLPIDVLNRMRCASARRGMTPNELARLIVETVVDNKLIDAVLDDAEVLA